MTPAAREICGEDIEICAEDIEISAVTSVDGTRVMGDEAKCIESAHTLDFCVPTKRPREVVR